MIIRRQRPCIAEYGQGFPRFLAARPGADRVPFLREFGGLEWDLGFVAIAIDQPALGAGDLSSIRADLLPDAVLRLQTGLRYVQASWPIDELIELYFTETAPESLEFKPADICIEVRGARGEFHINRLTLGELLFRKLISEGRSIGNAADAALNSDASFDPGLAMAALITEGLVTAVRRPGQERQ